jgi:hypothetical protein
MKIALCLSGQIRSSWRECVSSVRERIVIPFGADVFLSTWADDPETFLEYREVCRAYDCRLADAEIHHTASVHMHKKAANQIGANTERLTYLSMMHSINKCNNLKKLYENAHEFRYDIVMRARIDSFCHIPPHQEDLDFAMSNKNKLMIVPTMLQRRNFVDIEVGDVVAFGSSEVMDRFAEIYNVIPSSLRNLKQRSDVAIPNETIFTECLHVLGIEFVECKYHPNLEIRR